MNERPPEIDGLSYVRPLGAGGYAQVHLYDQHFPKRYVAVKVLTRTGMGDEVRAALAAEANAMAGVSDHPNIVPVFSAGITADGSPYLVMMYYSNGSLATKAQTERMDIASVLRIGIQISSAVESAHRAGILHRDIKPANIMVNQYGGTGLTDFGIAAQLHEVDEDDDAGVSVPWSGPEILYATAPASVQSDVYSLAATLWHLLVGRSPFEVVGGDNSPFALMRRIRDNPPPATGRTDVPAPLERLLRQALAKNPASRPSSAIDFARSLQAIETAMALPRTDIIVLSEPTPPPERPAYIDFRPPPDTGPTTRQRTIQPIAGQTAPPVPAGVIPEFDFPTSRRLDPNRLSPAQLVAGRAATGSLDDAVTATGSRSYTGAPGGPGAPGSYPTGNYPTDEAGRRRRRWPLVLGTVAVLAVAALAGFVMFGDHSGSPKPTETVASGVDTNVLPKAGPPGTPKIIGTRVTTNSATMARFTWSYDNALGSDRFDWRETTGTRTGTVGAPQLTITPSAGTQTCIEVKVIRADGTDAALSWSPAGCA